MAANALDTVWDKAMRAMSTSYVATLDLIEKGKAEEALAEYRKGFRNTLKQLYTEVSTTAPGRFAKANDWNTWARRFYVLGAKAEKALQRETQASHTKSGPAPTESSKLLQSLREHVSQLRRQTDTLTFSDAVCLFRKETLLPKPDIALLKQFREKIDQLPLPSGDEQQVATIRKAKVDWTAKVVSILQDGKVVPSETETLRTASEAFYRTAGRIFH